MNIKQSAQGAPVKIIASLFVTISILLGTCVSVAAAVVEQRPVNWATPVIGKPGLPNLNRVNGSLYRSAQPTKEGFVLLDSKVDMVKGDQPIKTVVSLRTFNDDAPVAPAVTGLRLEQIRFKTWHPENEDVIKFLRIATTPSMQPVLVHCQHGADRTGTMVAIYRIAYEGWSKKQATDEMINGGYGFHPMWQNLLRYIDKLDVNKIKEQVEKQGKWK